MLKDITMGQYFPGKSVIHRLDPRTKIILVVLYIVSLFTAHSYISYAVMAVYFIICVKISEIKFKMLIKGLKPLIIVIVFTAFLNLFLTNGDHVIFQIWRLRLTWEGIRTAAFMLLRLVLLIMGTFLLTYTTSPISLTDGLERLLNPLKKIKVPVHELAMMMSIALRFIPTLIEETDKIMSAQKARGANFETGSIFARAKALLPVMIPLFISAFRRANELAIAMESRCYHGGEGRTRMNVLVMRRRDYAAIAVGCIVLIIMIVLACFGL